MSDDANELVLSRVMDASVEKLWRCWSEPDLLAQWFCPKPWFVTDVRMDLRPGGVFGTVMNGPDGERFDNEGVFLEVVSQKRIISTDAFVPGWKPAARAFMVTKVEFEPMDDGRTKYAATARHWTAEAKSEHESMGFEEGWGKAADQLEALAKSL